MCPRKLTLVATPAAGPAPAPFRVAIIGGGFAGAAAALRLIEATAGALAITVIEPRAALGRGIAYSTPEPGHLMNGPARSLSLYPEAPLHFVRWLEAEAARGGWRPPEGTGWETSQPPRRHFGTYVESRLAATAADSFGRVRFRHRRDRAVGIGQLGREFVIALASGGTVVADAVVLASGVFQNGAGRRIAGAVAGDPRHIADPYAPGAFDGLAAAEEVVILGSGLAMLDALVSLERAGFRGRVRAVSRRGGLVEPRRAVEAAGDFLGDLPDGATPTLRGILRQVQAARRRIAAEGGDWQQLVPAVRAATPGLWVRLGDADRQRFVRHLQGVWKSCVHLAPIETHRLAERLRAEGRLTIEAGEVGAIRDGGRRLEVAVRDEADDERTIAADAVVDCLGHSADWSAEGDPLVRSLLDRGLAQRHPTGLGIDVDPLTLAVTPAAGGTGSRRLFAIGHPLRGSVWESTSVREIALQARSLGETLAAVSERGAERPPARRRA